MSKKSEEHCCRSAIAFVLTIIVLLIYFLDYYPLAIIKVKNGYCTNLKTELSIVG